MKIGLAFLVYRTIHNQTVWKKLINELEKLGHEVLLACHSKEPVSSDILEDLELTDTVDTRWAAPSLIEAEILLFSNLFARGAEIVYLVSGDTLPLPRSKGFMAFNEETTLALQDKYELDGYSDNLQYVQKDLFIGANQNKWNHLVFLANGIESEFANFEKQQMFFCINKKDFDFIYDKCVQENYFKRLSGLAPMDEYFWVNLFIRHGINFRNLQNYLYSHKRNCIETQAQNFRLRMVTPEIKNKYLFMRKIREEGAEIEFA